MNPFKYCNALNYLPISIRGYQVVDLIGRRLIGALILIGLAAAPPQVHGQGTPIRANAQVLAQIMQSVVMVEATART
jgi:hypothetical protein